MRLDTIRSELEEKIFQEREGFNVKLEEINKKFKYHQNL